MTEKTNDDPKRAEHGDQDSDREVWLLTRLEDKECDRVTDNVYGVFTSIGDAVERIQEYETFGTLKAMYNSSPYTSELTFTTPKHQFQFKAKRMALNVFTP